MKKYLSVAGNYKSVIGQFQNNSVNVAMLITMSRVIIVLYMYNYKRSFFNVSLFCYIKHSSVPYCRGQTKCIFSKFQPSVSFNNNNGLLICESLSNFYTSHFSSPNWLSRKCILLFHRRGNVSNHLQKQILILCELS